MSDSRRLRVGKKSAIATIARRSDRGPSPSCRGVRNIAFAAGSSEIDGGGETLSVAETTDETDESIVEERLDDVSDVSMQFEGVNNFFKKCIS